MRVRYVNVWAAALVAAGCGASESPPPVPADDTHTVTLRAGPAWPEVYVVVADDRPDATKLRDTLVRSFVDLDRPTGLAFDPAAFHPVDRRVIVAHPSAPVASVTSEVELPALHWHANQKTDLERAAWLDAMARALEPEQPEAGPFAALAAYASATSLALGARAPETHDETAIVAALPAEGTTYVIAALAHEDESAGDSASYAVPLGNSAYPGFAILPRRAGSPTSAACYDFGGATSDRYQAWVSAQHFYDVGHWPCSDESFLRPLIADFTEDCFPWSPRIDADGVAACTATAHVRVDATCDPAYGWLDPLGAGGERAPRVEHDAANDYDYRVCEVRQLTGSALASCVHSLDCPDCEPGWCATEVPELLEDCSTTHPDQFRFVQGSDSVAQGRLIIRCEAAESP
jgi:hypothetical protein